MGKAKNKHLKWLDAGAGRGNYSMCLFYLLFKGLKNIIIDATERKDHIIKNMIYLIEYNPDNIPTIKERFGKNVITLEQAFFKSDRSCKEISRGWAELAGLGWSGNLGSVR